jgi:choline dehydrogenase
VGQNLQDRYEIGVVSRVKPAWQAFRRATYTTADRQYRCWRRWGKGAYTSNGVLFSAMFPSRTNQQRPDLFCFLLLADFRGYYPRYSERIKKLDYLTWTVLKAYTHNTAGTVRLRSKDPLDRPDINFHYLSEGNCAPCADLDALVTGIKFGRKMMDAIGGLIAERGDSRSPSLYRRPAATPCRGQSLGPPCLRHLCHEAGGSARRGGRRIPRAWHAEPPGRRCVHLSPHSGLFIVTAVYMIAEKAADVLMPDMPN